MLSIGAMGHGQGDYYLGLAREDYYLSGGEPPGIWLGQGAQSLGLTGVVEPGALTRLLEGFHPTENGGALIQNAGARDHQPGWDLTFSAPKSVSVLWSQADPRIRKAIEDCHLAAVQTALAFIEETAAITRRGKGGHRKEDAQLIIAAFEHGTSRAQDPQLHTHCLVMNACTRADGTTGTIESKVLYLAKMATGALYRAELAVLLERGLWNLARTFWLVYFARSISCDETNRRKNSLFFTRQCLSFSNRNTDKSALNSIAKKIAACSLRVVWKTVLI